MIATCLSSAIPYPSLKPCVYPTSMARLFRDAGYSWSALLKPKDVVDF